MLRYVKVFGERNTGTNFLNQLIRKNSNFNVLEHQSNQSSLNKLNLVLPELKTKQYSESLRRLILDRLIDQQRKDEFNLNYGWKHSMVHMPELSYSARFENTLFIFLIRNPWRFVSALHKRPYNLNPRPRGDLLHFIDSTFIANERDGFKRAIVFNPVDLWNLKVESYYQCHGTLKSSLICFYENVVQSPQCFLESLRPFGLINQDIALPIESTKKEEKSFYDYQNEAFIYNPREELGDEVYLKILGKLDKDTLQKTIYSFT